MRDFPQELVEQVIDELFALVGRDNSYQGYSKQSRGAREPVWGISDYSLVSRAWAEPTQKHHFSTLYVDSPAILEKWVSRISPDPTGVSRHVRKLVLAGFDLEDFEDFEDHLLALTQVECLTVDDCACAPCHPFNMEWFSTIGSSLVELQINDSPVAPHTITSLLAVLPLLRNLQIHNLENPDDAYEADPPAPPKIPFFEGANRFALHSDYGHRYPERSLDWIPVSARFGQLEVDMACLLGQQDLVNRWLSSSCATLTSLVIKDDPDALISKELGPSSLLSCTALESLQIPISPFVETFIHLIGTSTQLAKVVLDLHGRFGRRAVQLGDRALDAIERCLCPIAKRFNDAHPGRKMEVEIVGYIGKQAERIRVLRALNDRMFMPTLKKEAKFVIPPI